METRTVGVFNFVDPLSEDTLNKLPDYIRLPSASYETILLRLLLGHLQFLCQNGKMFKLRKNYLFLPCQKAPILTYKSIHDSINTLFSSMGSNFNLTEDSKQLQHYLVINRKNASLYEHVLFEISSFLCCQVVSPIAAFTHIYRCLEYLSYSFPLVYAAKSRDYQGSFNDLKKFLSGDVSGELKFFQKFLFTLFNDEPNTLDYIFEMEISISYPFEAIKQDIEGIYHDFPYDLDGNLLRIKFKDMVSLFIVTRNRYFHMLVGQGQKNFSSTEYDIDEFFGCINPFLLNWISMVIQKITTYGFYSSLSV